jgi:hypothetical protein
VSIRGVRAVGHGLVLFVAAGGWAAAVPAVNQIGQNTTIAGVVVDSSGNPIPSASVSAEPIESTDGETPDVRQATTDEEGRFRIGGVQATTHRVRADARGYLGSGADQPVRSGDRVTIRLEKGGVITGRVTDEAGNPLVRIPVSVLQIRGPSGDTVIRDHVSGQSAMTDDRGSYRIYGLAPGIYVVAGGKYRDPRSHGIWTPYEEYSPVHHPTGGRASAAEVTVRAGQEVAGIDIQYRQLPMRAVRGVLAGLERIPNATDIHVVLLVAGTPEWVTSTGASKDQKPPVFELTSVPEGEYDLYATARDGQRLAAVSNPVRVVVRSGDAEGVRVELRLLASVLGRVEFETEAADCGPNSRSGEEVSVSLIPDKDGRAVSDLLRFPDPGTHERVERGRFEVRALATGAHHLVMHTANQTRYLKAVTGPEPQRGRAGADLSDGFALREGQKLAGVVISIGGDAAGVRGRVAGAEGADLPPDLTVHLVPAEVEQAENVLRYYETDVEEDGSFVLTNLAPGTYRLITHRAPAKKANGVRRPLAWDRAARAAVREEAKRSGHEFALAPCQRATGIVVRHHQARASCSISLGLVCCTRLARRDELP